MFKVLMVDDNYDNLVILRAILKAVAPECSSRFASSGEEALRIVAVDRPDMIILDILMPGMDGFQVCSRLKGDQGYSDIPVILLTAMDSSPENRTKGLKCGADAFLTKPVSEVELEAQMKALLGKKQQTATLKSDLKDLQQQVDKDRARLQFEGIKHWTTFKTAFSCTTCPRGLPGLWSQTPPPPGFYPASKTASPWIHLGCPRRVESSFSTWSRRIKREAAPLSRSEIGPFPWRADPWSFR